jgi:hypothetical protein
MNLSTEYSISLIFCEAEGKDRGRKNRTIYANVNVNNLAAFSVHNFSSQISLSMIASVFFQDENLFGT